MLTASFQLLADQPFIAIFLVLGLGHLLGRLSIGFFSVGSTIGSLLVALAVGVVAFELAGGVRFDIPGLVGTIFLTLFTYAIGLRVGPLFIEGLRKDAVQLLVLVLVTTTLAFAIAFGGSALFDLAPGFAPGILSGSNTISAVLGAASSAVDDGAFALPAGLTADAVKANLTAAYTLTYVFSMICIVLLVRNLPALFGIDPVAAAKRGEKEFGLGGAAAPGTSAAFEIGMQPVDVRVFRLENAKYVGRPVHDVFERLGTPVLRITRAGDDVPLAGNPALEKGDLLTVGGKIADLLGEGEDLGPEVADEAARHIDIDQAEIALTRRGFAGKTLEELHASPPAYGVRVRRVFRAGQELPLKPELRLSRHDVLRVLGPPEAVERLSEALGAAVRPTHRTDIFVHGVALAAGYLFGLISVPVAGIPLALGSIGGVLVAGILVSLLRTVDPVWFGPMPEGARSFLENTGVDVFVTILGLTAAPAVVMELAQWETTLVVLLLGVVCATVPTFISWLVGLYVLKMDPIMLAGAVAGARNSTTAMKAVSDASHSSLPLVGYAIPYALSTVAFLIYGYLAMILS